METTRAIAYQRVSTQEQSEFGHSLDAQEKAMRDEVERRGWELVEMVRENGSAGRGKARPELERVRSILAAGGADVLLSTRLDRVSRSVIDFMTLLEESRSQGWKIVLTEMGADFSTPEGRLLAGQLSSFAEYERDMISARTKAGLSAARSKGIVLGRPRSMAPKTRRRILRERARGDTFQKIAAGLNDDGVATAHAAEPGEPMVEFVHGKRWYASTVRHVTLAG